jgi:L-lactate dehydrogenase
VILVSNPVDVLTRIAIEASTRPPHLIFGCGTVLDGARLRHQLGKLLDVDEDSVHAYVIGEHGDSSFPVWSSATVGAIRLEQYGLPYGTSLPQIQHDLAAAVLRRGMSIHERKGFTSYGVAAAVARIVRAIVRDENGSSWFPCWPPKSTESGRWRSACPASSDAVESPASSC